MLLNDLQQKVSGLSSRSVSGAKNLYQTLSPESKQGSKASSFS